MKKQTDTPLIIENIKDPKSLGLGIKRLRKIAGLSQIELAKKTGMIQATISGLENGRGTIESFFKVIQVLRINLCLSNTSLESLRPSSSTKARSVWEKLKKVERTKSEL